MKREIILASVAVLFLTGCGKKEETVPAAQATPPAKAEGNSSGNPLTAPADYLGAVAKAKKVAEKTIDTAGLNQNIQLFYAQEGRFPKDLNELVTQKYIPAVPPAPYGMKIQYDATKGQVAIVKAE